MIGSIDMPKAEHDRLRNERAVAAKRAKRRSSGVVSRAQYEAKAKAMRAEAAALGTNYDAYRKRLQRARKPCPKSDDSIKACRLLQSHLGHPSPAATSLHEGGLGFVGRSARTIVIGYARVRAVTENRPKSMLSRDRANR